MWGKLTERNDMTQAKVIFEPQGLYRFLATPGIEVKNLAFASDDVVWISWRHAAREHVPRLRYTNEVIDAYITAGLGFIYISISTGYKRNRSIATQILSHTFNLEINLS